MVYLNLCCCIVFFFKHKTAYVVRISDWSSDVCSSDLEVARVAAAGAIVEQRFGRFQVEPAVAIVPGRALAELEARIAALGREAVAVPILVIAAFPLKVAHEATFYPEIMSGVGAVGRASCREIGVQAV